jgi:hypothetical protein
MDRMYRQFLGTRPGIVVELIDDSKSPYLVRNQDNFEYYISAEDFRNYYKPENSRTPVKWDHLITDSDQGLVDSELASTVIETVRAFEAHYKDFFEARSFVRDALITIKERPDADLSSVRESLKQKGWNHVELTKEEFRKLKGLNNQVKELLLSEICAAIRFPEIHTALNSPEQDQFTGVSSDMVATSGTKAAAKKPKQKKPKQVKAKNADISVQGDKLIIKSDLSQDFGPSKSGKTTIVASTEGNKPLPGREEKIGLNIYRQETARKAVGRKNEFKNVVMKLDGDILTLEVDLAQTLGDSKSGKTVIVATTGGNQLVFGRTEKIGLNVYRNK